MEADKLSKQQELLKQYNELNLLTLPEKFKKGGFDFELWERMPGACIYIKRKEIIIAYEVFITKIIDMRKEQELLKKLTGVERQTSHDYREVFPSDEDFGKRAWTYKNFSDALKCFCNLIARGEALC